MLRDGYAIRENVFSDEECAALLADLSDRDDLTKAGLRNLMRFDSVRTFASDSRLIALTRRLTGHELTPFKATLFNKAGKANWLVAWHQDTALPIESEVAADDWGPSSVKDGVTFSHAPSDVLGRILALRIHLDPSTTSNGPLRAIPRSHKPASLRRSRVSSDCRWRSAGRTHRWSRRSNCHEASADPCLVEMR